MFIVSVQHLSLRYNNITDVGASLLGTAFGTVSQQNQKLLSINLNGNHITDVGAESLAGVSIYTKHTTLYGV